MGPAGPCRPGGWGYIDVDWDDDNVLDSNSTFLNDSRYRLPYNNLAPRHPRKTANLNYVDGHADTKMITYTMAPPEENDDIGDSKLLWTHIPP